MGCDSLFVSVDFDLGLSAFVVLGSARDVDLHVHVASDFKTNFAILVLEVFKELGILTINIADARTVDLVQNFGDHFEVFIHNLRENSADFKLVVEKSKEILFLQHLRKTLKKEFRETILLENHSFVSLVEVS